MMTIELVEDPEGGPRQCDPRKIVEQAREHGLLLLKTGMLANMIRVRVPWTATSQDVSDRPERLGEAMDAAGLSRHSAASL